MFTHSKKNRHRFLGTLLLAAFASSLHSTGQDNPPVTDCNCPTYVSVTPDAPEKDGIIKLTPSKEGMLVISVEATPPSQGAIQPTFRILQEDGREVATATAWSHTFNLSTLDLKSPLTLETLVDCPNYSPSGKKICDTKKFSFGGCESGNCGSGTCQSGTGDPSCDVDPTEENPFSMELAIGMSSQGDDITSLYLSKAPASPIATSDFKVRSNGGYTHVGNVITTATTVTTIAAGGGGVTVEIKKAGTNEIFRTYQFNSVTTGGTQTLTLVETRCDQQPIVHVWSHTNGLYSFSRANGLRTITKSIEQDQNFVKIVRFKTYELVSGQDVLVSDQRLHFQTLPWGVRLVQRVIDPDAANLVSTWTYGGPSDGYGDGRVKTITRHDGSSETHTYGADFHQVDSSGNHQEKTTWGAGTTTYETRTNGILHAKTVETISGNTIAQRRYTSASEYLQTTTTYIPAGSDFGNQPASVSHPDGTMTTYSYARTSGNRVSTVRNGKFVSGTLTDGTTTVTTVNAQGQTIESITTDAPSQVVTNHTKALQLDGYGRPTQIGHFPNAQNIPVYSEARTYTCCKLTSETDIHGVTTSHQFDLLGRQTTTQTHGVVQETAYKGLTRTSHRYPAGQTATTANRIAENTSNLTGTIEESWQPDTSSSTAGALVSTTTTTTYNPGAGLSRTVTTTLPGNHSQTSEYLLDGRLKKSYGALSPHIEYAYTTTTTGLISARALLDGATHQEITATQTDWAGRPLASGRLATLTATTLTAATTHTYQPGTGFHLTTTDPDGIVNRFAYDNRGDREISVLERNGNTTTEYGNDQVTRSLSFYTTRTTAPLVPVLRSEVHIWQDGAGVNSPTLASYSERTPDGLLSWSWQIGGQVARAESTVGLNRTETSISPDGAYTLATYHSGLMDRTETYTSANVLITSVSVRNSTNTPLSGYDDLRRTTHRNDSRTGISSTTYRSATADVPASITDPGNRTTTFTHDNRGRQLSVTLPDNTVTYTSYTPRGEAEARWGSQAYPEFLTYDYAGRMKTLRTKPDLNQNIPVNTGGSLTTWNYYSDTGLLREKLDHNSKGPEYTYTAAGRLLTRDWARTLPATSTRVRTTYGYTHGRLASVTYNDGTPNLVYTYDNFGRAKTVTRAGNNHAEYLYDATHLRLITEKLNRDIQERHLHRHYDTFGRPLSINLATKAGTSQYTAGYGYDDASRLDRVWHHPTLASGVPQGNPTFTYGYTYTQASSGALRIGATTGSNLRQDFIPYTLTRNAVGTDPALTASRSYQGTRDALHSIENKAGASLVSSYTYNVNSMGQRTNVTTSGSAFGATMANWTWQYDSLGQLTAADSPTSARDRAYGYDPIGNRKKSAHGTLTLPASDNHTTNALNQYSVVPGYTPQPVHDLDGNLTRGPIPGTNGNVAGNQAPADATELKWDAENRLISCLIGTVTYYYAYDHLSRLMARGETTALSRRYYYDGWNRIAEYTNTSTALNTFTWGLDLSGTMQGAGGVGGLLAHRWVSDAGQPDYFPAYDGNGNVTEYLTTTGTVAAHYEYDPFGTLTRLTGSTSTRLQYRFSTKPRDWNTGLYYYGYRWYDPLTGRWPSRDPIGETGGENLYGFVGNDGVNKWDYLGLEVVVLRVASGDESVEGSYQRSLFDRENKAYQNTLQRYVSEVENFENEINNINSWDEDKWEWNFTSGSSYASSGVGKKELLEITGIEKKSRYEVITKGGAKEIVDKVREISESSSEYVRIVVHMHSDGTCRLPSGEFKGTSEFKTELEVAARGKTVILVACGQRLTGKETESPTGVKQLLTYYERLMFKPDEDFYKIGKKPECKARLDGIYPIKGFGETIGASSFWEDSEGNKIDIKE